MRTLIIAVLWLCTHFAFATHLRSGEISVRQIGAYSTIVKITITVYTNEGSLVEFGGIPGEEDILDFGDGTSMLVPEQKSTHRPDLGPLVGVAQYTVLHHYRARGQYLISYREPNRNEGVLNMDNSVNTRFFIKTLVTVGDESFTTPAFHAPPIFKAISGSAYNCSLAGDHDDDVQLYYTLSPSFDAMDVPVKNYKIPSGVELNPVTGIFSWDTSAAGYLFGEYNFAVIVYQVKDERLIGYTLRDF